MQIQSLCPAIISRLVRAQPFEFFLIRVCFWLNKALRKSAFSVCAERSLCTLPVCLNLSEFVCD